MRLTCEDDTYIDKISLYINRFDPGVKGMEPPCYIQVILLYFTQARSTKQLIWVRRGHSWLFWRFHIWHISFLEVFAKQLRQTYVKLEERMSI